MTQPVHSPRQHRALSDAATHARRAAEAIAAERPTGGARDTLTIQTSTSSGTKQVVIPLTDSEANAARAAIKPLIERRRITADQALAEFEAERAAASAPDQADDQPESGLEPEADQETADSSRA